MKDNDVTPEIEKVKEEESNEKVETLVNDQKIAEKDEQTKQEEDNAQNKLIEEETVTCDHQQQHTPSKNSGFRKYCKGFMKRVIFCTLLVILVRTLWPKIQPFVWPEDAGKEGKMYVLTNRSFRGHVGRGDHFLMMYAPWCGHCQRLKPAWEKLSKNPGVKGVKIGKVDCTAEDNICKQYSVSGYPTLLYFRNGEKIDKYDGDKSLDALKQYLKKMELQAKPSQTNKKKQKMEKKEL